MKSDVEPKSVFPLLVYFHGGGFITGSIEENDFRLQMLCVEHQISILNVDYRLAPEYPFPVPMDDCMAAMKWAIANPSLLSTDVRKGLIVMGTSAGAQLATVTALRARDDGFFAEARLTGQILQIPMTCHPDAYPEKYSDQLLSLQQNANAPKLTAREVRFAWKLLKGPPSDLYTSPLLAPLHRLPPTFLQVTGLDPLRDDGLVYERLLREAGVKTMLQIYPGVPHTFEITYPEIAAAKKYKEDLDEGLRWVLRNREQP
ncbi:Alpha/Beta hydrolase protein [Vararia minispora EC-137]|uniref:Alpha/Beta hydrolase protein n=1 Tax=Vararia minispora EC-137 TaxID=1314806 RepID=A0ACB8QGK3_9AGAM|nr:Alpha/Beta hydrolase protein [Vararia minispora EC-137]